MTLFHRREGLHRLFYTSSPRHAKADAELDSLRLTGDFFKKIVIRRDIPTSFYDDDGIFNCNLLDFLMNRVEP